jgi:TolA-binding protein
MSSNWRLHILHKLVLLLASVALSPAISWAQDLVVSVRERSGEPLTAEAFVRVTWQGRGQTLVGTTGGLGNEVSTASFQVEAGEYDIEVEAAGYDKATEHASINVGGTRSTVYVFMTRTGSAPTATAVTGVTLAPRVQKELQKSTEAMQHNKYDEARKHLEKAREMAPSSPDIQYMMGMLDYTVKDMPGARKQFESVIASYPTHERSLLMLGQMQLQAKEYKEASATLEKAAAVDSKNWRAHYLLALASAHSGDLAKARVEAGRAGELNPEKAAAMRILSARLLLMEGKVDLAEEAFQSFIKSYPQDPAVPDARKYIEKIEEARKTAAAAAVSTREALEPRTVDSEAAGNEKLEEAWAPPDVDAGIPPTAVGIACSLASVLENAQKRILRQLGDLERFSATERVEHQVLQSSGMWTKPLSRDFYYVISVYHRPKLPYYFVEDRTTDGSSSLFPTEIATRGLVSLGFVIINPAYAKDFEFSCEGLGNWNGKPAWQLHFAQRKNVPSHVREWVFKGTTYSIPLKGRMWIGANNFNIMHLETTLREPVPGLRLKQEQLMVDYGPVRFQSAATELWLPSQGEMYFDLLGHRYHHKHTLTNYLLFDVDTKNKIKAPPAPPDQDH